MKCLNIVLAFIIGCVWLINAINVFDDSVVIVTSQYGKISGKKLKSLFDNRDFVAFKGIPYARPPIGELRFKPPIKSLRWNDTLDGSKFGDICMQLNDTRNGFVGNENCLFLNIYTPDPFSITKLPVMFWIHGGGYFFGSGNDDLYGPDILINENIVLVTINYRLGPFGFLSLGTNEFSGNMGLKDQQFALKWVYENINDFGGDQNKITLFGQSAGGSSVGFQIASPESRKYFQRAIPMSGSILNIWAFSKFQNHTQHIEKIVTDLGGTNTTYEHLVEFLRNVNSLTFMEKAMIIYYKPGGPRKYYFTTWAPLVENIDNENAFLTQHPEEILKNNKNSIDVLQGYTDREALMDTSVEINNPEILQPFDDKFEVQFPRLDVELDYESDKYKKMSQEIRKFYFGDYGHVDNTTLSEFVDLLTDIWYNYSIDRYIKAQAILSSGKTYYYRFSVDADLNMFKKLFNVTQISGAAHADDLCYIFRCNIMPYNYTATQINSIEMKTIKAMTTMWANFARNGDPSSALQPINFKPIKNDQMNYLEISNLGLKPYENLPQQKRIELWNSLYERYVKSGSSEIISSSSIFSVILSIILSLI